MNCRYPLTGLDQRRCPECGRGFEPADATSYLTSTRTMHWIHVPLGLALLGGMVGWVLYVSGSLWLFVDPIAVIWLAGVLLGGLWMSVGPGAMGRALLAAVVGRRDIDRDTCAMHLLVFARAYQLAWGGGLIGMVMGMIIMLANLDDPSIVGPGLAVLLMPVFYGALLAEAVIAPLQQAIASRSGQSGMHLPLLAVPHRSVQGVAMAVVFALLAAVLVFMMASVRL
ncbi:MAG: MotA/TolQ/ExbB proton channel family protein [Phycisphaeraceae bacterium]